MIRIFYTWFREYWPCMLILLTIIGFVSKALYNYPMGLMALIGLYRIVLSPRAIWNDQIQKTFIIAFMCLWVPVLISFPDAVNQTRTAHTLFPYLRFLFAGLFIIQELSRNDDKLKFIVFSVFIIVIFWCIDASIQFFMGHNLLGFPYESGKGITGMFYPRNTISHICSILSAFCFLVVYQNMNKNKWLWLMLIPLFFVILISGRRAAWIMLALSSFGFFIYLFITAHNKKLILKMTGIIILTISVTLGSTIILHEPTNERFKVTLGLFSSDYDTIDKATALRLPIWETAYKTFKENPINGIGPRGFRYVYSDYASPNNFWVNQTHPHLLILEIMAETGVIGLLGYFILIYILINGACHKNKLKNELPFLIPVLVALFPFNAHMAFYGSIWSSMIWLLMAIYFSNVRVCEQRSIKY
jgi:O-antigen ligase